MRRAGRRAIRDRWTTVPRRAELVRRLVPLDLQTGCLDDAAHAEGNGESRLQSELGHRRQYLFQSEQDLALGEVDAQAAMNAESERHVRRIAAEHDLVGILIRSEEHTSELQSLMRTSNAV